MKDIDEYRDLILSRLDIKDVTLRMMSRCVHESTAYEGNTLSIGECQRVVELSDLEKLIESGLEDFVKVVLPDPMEFMPEKDRRQVLEVRNLVALCRYSVVNLDKMASTVGPSIADIKLMHQVLMDGILELPPLEETARTRSIWDLPYRGVFRDHCIQASGREFTVFPYPLEVDALMAELISLRDKLHKEKSLHPLLIAAHYGAVFKHIHPFGDGNGRLGRFLTSDYLLRQGYLPIVFGNPSLPKEEYIEILATGQEGDPEAW